MPVLPEWNAFLNVTEATLAEALMPPGEIMGLRPWTAVTCIMFAMVSCVVFMCFCVTLACRLALLNLAVVFWTPGFIASVLEASTPDSNPGDCISLLLCDLMVVMTIVQMFAYHRFKVDHKHSPSLLPM